MNLFTPTRFVETITRLALGVEPVDALEGGTTAHPVRVFNPAVLRGLARPAVERHDSGRHALLYQRGVETEVVLRVAEPTRTLAGGGVLYARRYVPRQFRFPVPTAEEADALTFRVRVRRPALFPGAAYEAPSMATGIRGRVERNGAAARWCRVEARAGTTLVGRGHSDDRGEFLLVLGAAANAGSELAERVSIRVDVFAPAAAPVPETPELPGLDPFWDLPVENASPLDPDDPGADPVSAGEVLPTGFTATTGRTVEVPLGTLHSEAEPFAIP